MYCTGTKMDSIDQSRGLLNLPNELKLKVVSFLETQRDLFNLSQVSAACEDMVLQQLYASVDVEIPQSVSAYWRKGGFSLLRPHVVQAVRELAIRNGSANCRSPVFKRRRISDAGCAEEHLRDIVGQMRKEQLTSLTFLHRSPISPPTLELLATSQTESLQSLALFEVKGAFGKAHLPHNLSILQCHAIGDGLGCARLVEENRTSLRRLRLGQEREMVERYRQGRIGFLEAIPQPLDTIYNTLQLQDLPRLHELDLCGINLSRVTPATVEEGLQWCKLTRLTLESCPESGPFLEALAGAFFVAQNPADASTKPHLLPQLQHFLFRSEAPTNALKETLTRFLASFRGLESLSLLFENAVLLEGAATMIAEHGPTLKTLVLESRIQPRESLSLDTSRPFGVGGFSEELWEQLINDICQLCPNLVELGTGFPWADEIVRLRRTLLPTLKSLKTIHIRNFPESQVLSQLGDYTIKEYATKFVEWVFPASKGGSKPSLELLAIGPTIHESRWKSNDTRRQPPEFLRTHYFCLDFGKTRFGRWSPMITSVSEKCVEELRGEKPLCGVFEPIWLK